MHISHLKTVISQIFLKLNTIVFRAEDLKMTFQNDKIRFLIKSYATEVILVYQVKICFQSKYNLSK